MNKHLNLAIGCVLFLTFHLRSHSLYAQNPIIQDQFSADPTARVFDGKVYLYPSRDILAPSGKNLRKDWFCMEDYHVFSSENLIQWKDHGMIVSQTGVLWAKPDAYSMWAPDCVERNGRYYFYFPTIPDSTYGKGFAIGVAIADKPVGPFVPQSRPILNVHGIDPNVFIDKDGQAYLYWSERNIYVAKLKNNMVELDSEPVIISNLPAKGLKEGPFLFERNGIYYLTFPHVENRIERLEYATADNPLGPFKMTGVIMDESPVGCWTNHHSIVQFKNQWYLFYHSNDLSPRFDKNRSVRIDSLFFNTDGTIKKVTPTFRGVGCTKASDKIQIDRYSNRSQMGVSISFLDSSDTFKGWKTKLEMRNAWIRYNAVDFGNKNKYRSVRIRAFSAAGGTLELRANNPDGTKISEIQIPKCSEFKELAFKMLIPLKGIQNLVFVKKDESPVEVDWISFE